MHFLPSHTVKVAQNGFHFFRDALKALFFQCRRKPIVSLGNASGNTSRGIRIATDGDGVPHGIFKIRRFQESDHGLRHGALASHIHTVGRTNFLQCAGEIVAELLLDVLLDRLFGFSYPSKIDGACHRLCAFDTFGVIMRNLCRPTSNFSCALDRVVKPAYRRYPHRRTVAETAIRFRYLLLEPLTKFAPVSCFGIFLTPILHGGNNRRADFLLLGIFTRIEQGIRYGYGHNGIIGKTGCFDEQGKRLDFFAPVKFVRRTDHVT